MYNELLVQAKLDQLAREVRDAELLRAVRELDDERKPGNLPPDPASYGRIGWTLALTQL